MNRCLCLFVVIVAVCLFPFSASGSDPLKIGVVDLQKCMAGSVEGKRVFEELKKKKDVMQKKLDNRQNALLQLKEKIEKQSVMLSPDARENQQKDFERQRREFKYIYDDLSNEMRKAEAETMKKMLKELGKIVSSVGEKGNYDLILERTNSAVVYLNNAFDITDKVTKAYNDIQQQE